MSDVPYELRPAGRPEPAGALVLFHGRGADEHDLVPILDVLDPHRRLVGLTPGGPLSLPPGGKHWYVVERVGFPQRETFDATFASLSAWVDALPALTGVPLSRTILGGFSQGAVMSYALGLGAGRPSPAGILAMSGFIPTVEGFEVDLASRAGLPVAIAHGTHDPVITVEFGRDARDRLTAAGLDVAFREAPVGHGIDPRGIDELRAWVDHTVPAASAE